MKAYLSVFRIRFITALQYRAAAVAGISTQFAWGFLEIFAFQAFYRGNPAAYPMEFSQLVSYIWLQQAFLAIFMIWFRDKDILEAISGGNIAYEMARPIDIYNRWLALSVANRTARSLLRFSPILIVAFLLPEPIRLSLPQNLTQFTGFVISLTLGLGVVSAFCMIIYGLTFFTLSSTGLWFVLAMTADFLAGSIIPLPFFPGVFRKIAELLPFASMQNLPLRIYSGNIAGSDMLIGIAIQLFWLIVLITAGRLITKKALTRVIVQGG